MRRQYSRESQTLNVARKANKNLEKTNKQTKHSERNKSDQFHRIKIKKKSFVANRETASISS